jgi:hypothetical protein
VARDAHRTPGPNNYTIPDKVVTGPKYSVGGKFEIKDLNAKNPGPGQYNLQNTDNVRMKRGSNFSIGTSERKPMALERKTPGPGNYQFSLDDKNKSPNYGFGSGTREHGSPTTIKSISPGPGNYVIRSRMGNEGKKNSIHSKILYKPIEAIGG